MSSDIMKIEVTHEQPVEHIEKELLRLGFTFNCGCDVSRVKMIVVHTRTMQYDMYGCWIGSNKSIVTLEDLRGLVSE